MSSPHEAYELQDTQEWSVLEDGQKFAPKAALNNDQVAMLLDPTIEKTEKLLCLVPVLDDDNERGQDFREFAAREYGITSVFDILMNAQTGNETAEERFLQAGIDYAGLQNKINQRFADPDFDENVGQEAWDALQTMTIDERLDFTEHLYESYKNEQATLAEEAQWQQELTAASRSFAKRESQRQVDAETELTSLLKNEAFTDWLLDNELDKVLLQKNLTPSQMLNFLQKEFSTYKSGLGQAEPNKSFSPTVQNQKEKTDISKPATVSVESVGSAELTREQRKRALSGLVVASVVAAAMSASSNEPISLPGNINGTIEQKISGKKVGLSPNAVNPALEVPSASLIAQRSYSIKPDQVIPKKHKQRVIQAGITSAETSVRTISANPELKKEKIIFNRQSKKVRTIDALSGYTILRLKHDTGVTPEEVDEANRSAVKAMMAARYPEFMEDQANDYDAETKFQKDLAARLRSVLFQGETAYTKDQQELITLLLAQAVDDTTVSKEQAEAVAQMVGQAEEITGNSAEVHVENPTYTLAEILAGVSIMESGSPARNVTNRFGYKGPWQMSPEYWHKPVVGWAKQYLGDENAPMSLDNMTMVAIGLWTDNMNSLGSAEAGMATWLKGPAAGAAIAGKNQVAYDQAMKVYDGNGTTVRKYITRISKDIDGVNVHKQLPFLKEVMKRNPDFDWSVLNKEFQLRSSLHMKEIKAKAQKQASIRSARTSRELLHAVRLEAARRIVASARQEYKRNGNKFLETGGDNTGPEVRRYTGGPQGHAAPWCAWFVSYVMRDAGYEFKGRPAGRDGNIPAVRNLLSWFKQHGMQFSANSDTLKPRPGDVIMYGGNKHTGIVVAVRGSTIETIEGNTSGNNRYVVNGGTVGYKRFNYKVRNRAVRIDFGRLRRPQ